MVLHISKERFEAIQAQGYPLGSYSGEIAALSKNPLSGSVTTYHVLETEEGLCPVCGEHQESVLASTPVDLEMIKTRMSNEASA